MLFLKSVDFTNILLCQGNYTTTVISAFPLIDEYYINTFAATGTYHTTKFFIDLKIVLWNLQNLTHVLSFWLQTIDHIRRDRAVRLK